MEAASASFRLFGVWIYPENGSCYPSEEEKKE